MSTEDYRAVTWQATLGQRIVESVSLQLGTERLHTTWATPGRIPEDSVSAIRTRCSEIRIHCAADSVQLVETRSLPLTEPHEGELDFLFDNIRAASLGLELPVDCARRVISSGRREAHRPFLLLKPSGCRPGGRYEYWIEHHGPPGIATGHSLPITLHSVDSGHVDMWRELAGA